ncbi:endonuclease/exonuclease/phosphatase family protein [Streptomyces olivaceoviridis]|uniref:Endonuclease/exonuclease/phosphatase family protein n=1 Tax=Streptomyces olivaceoviridis TaxID=1921 RepID=A0ABW7VI77_STROI|nr:endonuclease/exonuclease/phosphatase family protein [Streptomyces corchorusii]
MTAATIRPYRSCAPPPAPGDDPLSFSEPALDTEIRIVCWNVEHNGRGRHGGEDHRDLARDILASIKPHVVLRQELTGAWDRGKADLYAEANRLGGLTPFMTAPREGRSRNPVGVMVDPNLFFIDGEFEHDMPWKPICNPRVRLRGCARSIDLASAHLCHFDPDMRATEARRLTTLADNSRSALVGMDANSYPHQAELESVALPDWGKVEDRVHYQHRTIERAGRRVSDTRPDEILSGGDPVFIDLGLHAATALGQPGALAATASLKRTDQGPAQRIDRMYCTPDLAPALTAFEVLATDDVRTVSDHAMLLARFDLDVLRRVLTPTR